MIQKYGKNCSYVSIENQDFTFLAHLLKVVLYQH
jgi:hypothetical protein